MLSLKTFGLRFGLTEFIIMYARYKLQNEKQEKERKGIYIMVEPWQERQSAQAVAVRASKGKTKVVKVPLDVIERMIDIRIRR